jgi:hypothetical protein
LLTKTFAENARRRFAEWRRVPTIFIYAQIRRGDTRKRTQKDAREMIDWAI